MQEALQNFSLGFYFIFTLILKQTEDHHVSESILCFHVFAQWITSSSQHFLKHSVQVLAKEGLFMFYRMSSVLWVLYLERGTSAFTQ